MLSGMAVPSGSRQLVRSPGWPLIEGPGLASHPELALTVGTVVAIGGDLLVGIAVSLPAKSIRSTVHRRAFIGTILIDAGVGNTPGGCGRCSSAAAPACSGSTTGSTARRTDIDSIAMLCRPGVSPGLRWNVSLSPKS